VSRAFSETPAVNDVSLIRSNQIWVSKSAETLVNTRHRERERRQYGDDDDVISAAAAGSSW